MRPDNLDWGGRDQRRGHRRPVRLDAGAPGGSRGVLAASLWDFDAWAADATRAGDSHEACPARVSTATTSRHPRGLRDLGRGASAAPRRSAAPAGLFGRCGAPSAPLRTRVRGLRRGRCGAAAGLLPADTRLPFPASAHPHAAGLGPHLEPTTVPLGVAEHLAGEHLRVDLLGHGQHDWAQGARRGPRLAARARRRGGSGRLRKPWGHNAGGV